MLETTKLTVYAMGSPTDTVGNQKYKFVLGDAYGYGDCVLDDDTGELVFGGITYAPTHSDFAFISAAIDALSDEEFLELCVNAPREK